METKQRLWDIDEVWELYCDRANDPFPEKFVPAMPDIAVEIRSPSNTISEMRKKAQRYLRHGSKLAWIIMPANQRVEIHRSHSPVETLEIGDTLSGDDILPGFTLALRRLFN